MNEGGAESGAGRSGRRTTGAGRPGGAIGGDAAVISRGESTRHAGNEPLEAGAVAEKPLKTLHGATAATAGRDPTAAAAAAIRQHQR